MIDGVGVNDARRSAVRLTSLGAAIVLAMAATSPANAIGCLSGAAAGAVAGHFAHHHAVAGAVVGCVVGHEIAVHRKHQKNAHGH
jgi:hypothetical protein